jgi:hypothetical protein
MKQKLLRCMVAVALAVCASASYGGNSLSATNGKKLQQAKVCSNPSVPCRTSVKFEAYDLPFQVPKNAVIWETVDFYAIILKSVAAPGGGCEQFVSEDERVKAQALFPGKKVFASRPCNPGGLFYTNVVPDTQFMAVYAGQTKAQAEQMLNKAQGTRKFPGANIRRMRAGFNGT